MDLDQLLDRLSSLALLSNAIILAGAIRWLELQ